MKNYMLLKLNELSSAIEKLENDTDIVIKLLDYVEKEKAKESISKLGDNIHYILKNLMDIKSHLIDENDIKKIENNNKKIHVILEKLLMKKIELGA